MSIYSKKLLMEFLVDLIFSLINIYLWINRKFSKEKIKHFLFHHHTKNLTTNMGGIPILISLLPSFLIYNAWYVNGLLLGNFFIGLLDDLYKKKNNINNNYKIIMWFALNIIMMYIYQIFNGGSFSLPLGYHVDLSYIYPICASIFILLTINGVNMTDGLDGLVSFPLLMNLFFFMIISYMANNYKIFYFSVSIIAVIISFLFFNIYPAKIFMSDSGSLLLGSLLAILYLQTKSEFFIFIVGGIFVVNIFTSFLQIIWIQFLHRKLFKMAPLHHHFEMLKIHETTIVFYNWLISTILLFIGVVLYLSNTKERIYPSNLNTKLLQWSIIIFTIFLFVLFISLEISRRNKKSMHIIN